MQLSATAFLSALILLGTASGAAAPKSTGTALAVPPCASLSQGDGGPTYNIYVVANGVTLNPNNPANGAGEIENYIPGTYTACQALQVCAQDANQDLQANGDFFHSFYMFRAPGGVKQPWICRQESGEISSLTYWTKQNSTIGNVYGYST